MYRKARSLRFVRMDGMEEEVEVGALCKDHPISIPRRGLIGTLLAAGAYWPRIS